MIEVKQGIQFRQWATQRLKDYLIKGFALNQQRLKDNFEELPSNRFNSKILANFKYKSNHGNN